VSYCCNGIEALPDAAFSNTDGFNSGWYWIGGSATLASVEAYLNANSSGFLSGKQFSLEPILIGGIFRPFFRRSFHLGGENGQAV
jgi:hypothetical protein